MLENLINSKSFAVSVLKRQASQAAYPDDVSVQIADLSSVNSIAAAMEKQDAVISTVGREGIREQRLLIEAAVMAGVKRFLPSDFGCDMHNLKTVGLPVYLDKIAIHEQLKTTAQANPSFSYTLVCNNAFLDWGLRMNFLLNWKETKPKFFDGGEKQFSATTLDSVGQAVIGVLRHPNQTENRTVYVKDIDISQKQLFNIAKRIDPEKRWEDPIEIDTAGLVQSSDEKLSRGELSPQIMFAYLLRTIFGPPEYGGRIEKSDNELLGVKGKTEEDVEKIMRSIMTSQQ